MCPRGKKQQASCNSRTVDTLRFTEHRFFGVYKIHGQDVRGLAFVERIGAHECIKLEFEGTINGRTEGMTGPGRESGSEWSAKTNGIVYFAVQEGTVIRAEITSLTTAASTIKRIQWSTDGTLKRQVSLVE